MLGARQRALEGFDCCSVLTDAMQIVRRIEGADLGRNGGRSNNDAGGHARSEKREEHLFCFIVLFAFFA